jgi:hypothetical protein
MKKSQKKEESFFPEIILFFSLTQFNSDIIKKDRKLGDRAVNILFQEVVRSCTIRFNGSP